METKRERLIKTGICAGLLAFLAATCVFLAHRGLGIPCMFHLLTGFDCPSCGISRMGLALLDGNLALAWQANPVILCMLPFLLVLALRVGWRYIQTGSMQTKGAENLLLYTMIAVLLLYGVLRNLG